MEVLEYYDLMHKDISFGTLLYSKETGSIKFKIDDTNYLPVGGRLNSVKLHNWWDDRAIPISRQGLNRVIQQLSPLKVQNLMLDNLALSLTDCYWVRPFNSGYAWNDVNMYTNIFCDKLGEELYTSDFSIQVKKGTRFLPSTTTQGELKKKWIIDAQGKRVLLKGNYGNTYRQSLNEVFVSEIHNRQGFRNYVKYKLIQVTEASGLPGVGCACEAFTSDRVEFISGWEICQLFKQKQNMNWYHPYVETCIKLGVNQQDLIYNLDYMILSDYVMSNTDRHFNNFGLLRDADTL